MPNPQTQSSLVSAITDQPVLVAPESERLFGSLLQELAQSSEFGQLYDASATATAAGPADDDFWDESDPWVAAFRPYNVVNGVLQIPVFGVLLNRFGFQFGRRATGYQYIERAFNRGIEDPQVKAIALVVDSRGGEVAGNFELVEKMAAQRGTKPIRAFAADHSYSAAYSISTAAESIIMTRSGGVGSVGVVVAHVEMSEMLKDWGIKVTFIFAGKHKVDGNAYEKLSDAAKSRIQARVDRIYGEFTGLVASNRGMEEKAVRDTEALTFDASEAIEIGFADKVGALEEEMAVFAQEAADMENELMTTQSKAQTPAAPEDGQANAITQEQHDAAVAAAKSDGVAEGATGERTRINAILDSDEGKARPKAALSAALKTTMTSDEAIAFLGSLPEEKAEAPAQEPKGSAPKGDTPFNSAMSGSDNPEVGADGGDGDDPEAVNSTMLLGALRAATGKPKKAA